MAGINGTQRARGMAVFVGIDPDVDRSGVARLDMVGGAPASLSLSSIAFGALLFFLSKLRDEMAAGGTPCVVVVEAGWANKGNWHVRWSDNNKLACAKGYNVGRNHEAGRKIVELVKALGFHVDEVRPLRKIWKGKDGKISAAEFGALTGFRQRSTQDARDAGLLAWNAAGLPLRISVSGGG